MTEDEYEYPYPLERPKILIPAILFVITLFTTTISGAFFEGINPFKYPPGFLEGLPFSISLMLILGTHELGHFIASRHHGVVTTLPTFIPGPPIPPMIGTFGAVIKIKSPIEKKNALIDIGASGPLAGFIVAIIIVIIGLKLSWIIPTPYGDNLGLGSSLLFHFLSELVVGPIPEGFDLVMHPVAFSGWIGFFITSINLLPIGQLDGGHMLYAIVGKSHRQVSIVMVATLLAFGFLAWTGWLIWAVLVTIIGLSHPPTMDPEATLDPRRKAICAITLIVFVLTFTPTPFYII